MKHTKHSHKYSLKEAEEILRLRACTDRGRHAYTFDVEVTADMRCPVALTCSDCRTRWKVAND